MIERLQTGHVPLLSHNSLEHTLQKVCPHGIKAVPLLLSMHTQHIQSPLLFSLSFLFVFQSPPSISSNNLISDFTSLAPVGPPSPSSLLRFLSAARAIAKFIPEAAELRAPSSLWLLRLLPWRLKLSPSIIVKADDAGLHEPPQPQHPIPFNPSRCFKLAHLRPRFARSISSAQAQRNSGVK